MSTSDSTTSSRPEKPYDDYPLFPRERVVSQEDSRQAPLLRTLERSARGLAPFPQRKARSEGRPHSRAGGEGRAGLHARADSCLVDSRRHEHQGDDSAGHQLRLDASAAAAVTATKSGRHCDVVHQNNQKTSFAPDGTWRGLTGRRPPHAGLDYGRRTALSAVGRWELSVWIERLPSAKKDRLHFTGVGAAKTVPTDTTGRSETFPRGTTINAATPGVWSTRFRPVWGPSTLTAVAMPSAVMPFGAMTVTLL